MRAGSGRRARNRPARWRRYPFRMATIIETLKQCASIATEAMAETLWPTRCAVCDAPGQVLCDACRARLPYLDWWRACPRCGAPFGRVQCTECNDAMLQLMGRARLPFASCASATVYEGAPARIVRTYKDRGERRLARELAYVMAASLPPAWRAERPALAAVPATGKALRARGFDHMADVAAALSELTGLPLTQPLARPRSIDQRNLGRKERFENMRGRFAVLPGATVPPRILLVDDVLTTGATLMEAADALLAGGAQQVRCLTFARVW